MSVRSAALVIYDAQVAAGFVLLATVPADHTWQISEVSLQIQEASLGQALELVIRREGRIATVAQHFATAPYAVTISSGRRIVAEPGDDVILAVGGVGFVFARCGLFGADLAGARAR